MIIHKPFKTLNLITISQKALLKNYRYFQKLHPHSIIAPVLKSNAYGHGLTVIGKFIDQNIKPHFVCVDSVFEAQQLQKVGFKGNILLIGYTDPENYQHLKHTKQLSFPIFDFKSLDTLLKYHPDSKIHLKIDTGMNRLGIQPERVGEWLKKLKSYPHVNIEGIYSHLSQADNTTFTDYQVKLFKQVIHQFESVGHSFKYKHISATSGSLAFKDPEFNMVRLGIGFYTHPNSALTFTTTLIQTKRVGEGSEISYDGTYITKKPATIGIIPVGYSDGLDRRLSNKGTVTIRNHPCKILGNVCMNLTVIDLSHVPKPRVGEKVTIISPKNLNSIAAACQTIPYQILTSLAPSTRRILYNIPT